MKQSRRYFLGSLAAAAVAVVLIVAANRLIVPPESKARPLRRAAAAELAALRDFTDVRIEGDFVLEVSQAPEYSVRYAPVSDTRGELVATLEGQRLLLRGFGNSTGNGEVATVRVTLPVLRDLDVFNVPVANVSEVADGPADVRATAVGKVRLTGNTAELNVVVRGVRELQMDAASLAVTRLRVQGDTRITTLD